MLACHENRIGDHLRDYLNVGWIGFGKSDWVLPNSSLRELGSDQPIQCSEVSRVSFCKSDVIPAYLMAQRNSARIQVFKKASGRINLSKTHHVFNVGVAVLGCMRARTPLR